MGHSAHMQVLPSPTLYHIDKINNHYVTLDTHVPNYLNVILFFLLCSCLDAPSNGFF